MTKSKKNRAKASRQRDPPQLDPAERIRRTALMIRSAMTDQEYIELLTELNRLKPDRRQQ